MKAGPSAGLRPVTETRESRLDVSSLPYQIIRKPRLKSASITIRPSGEIVLSIPKNFSAMMIQAMLEKHSGWIEKKLSVHEVLRKKYPPKQYLPGDLFPYLGKNYSLVLVESSRRKVELTETELKVFAGADELYAQEGDCTASIIQAWYEASAARVLKERVQVYEEVMRVKGGKLEIKTVNSFWGSCAQDGYLRFNARLMMAPLEVVDYVVVHELAHLTHRNHSRLFWSRVREVLPDYPLKRRWLSRHGHFLTF